MGRARAKSQTHKYMLVSGAAFQVLVRVLPLCVCSSLDSMVLYPWNACLGISEPSYPLGSRDPDECLVGCRRPPWERSPCGKES